MVFWNIDVYGVELEGFRALSSHALSLMSFSRSSMYFSAEILEADLIIMNTVGPPSLYF